MFCRWTEPRKRMEGKRQMEKDGGRGGGRGNLREAWKGRIVADEKRASWGENEAKVPQSKAKMDTRTAMVRVRRTRTEKILEEKLTQEERVLKGLDERVS